MSKSVRALVGESTYKILENCNTPEKVQAYIDDHIAYDPCREDRGIERQATNIFVDT